MGSIYREIEQEGTNMINDLISVIKRIYCRLHIIQAIDKRLMLTYNPDSNYLHKQFPELADLWMKFNLNNENANFGDFTRFYSFMLNLNHVMNKGIQGELCELGVYKGNTAAILNFFSEKYNRRLFLYDTFEGFLIKICKGLMAIRGKVFRIHH